MDFTKAFGFLSLHHVEEFPRECVKHLIDTAREKGIAGLKEDIFCSMSCLFTVAAWALGKIKQPDTPDQPDDGLVIFGASDGDAADKLLMAECCEAMNDAIGRAQPMGGLMDGFIARQLLNLAMAYAVSMVSDPDKVQEVVEAVVKLINEKLGN